MVKSRPKYLDYKLTSKGLEYINTNEFWKDTSSKKAKVLLAMTDGGSPSDYIGDRVYYLSEKEIDPILMRLEKKGLIEKDFTDVPTLLSSLPDSKLKSILGVYSRVAHSQYVPDSVLDRTLDSVETFNTEGVERPYQKLLKSAKTRGDKEVALDAFVSYVHARGHFASGHEFPVNSELDTKVYYRNLNTQVTISRILEKLKLE